MAESKYRYRIPPCPTYDIPATEGWLEDLAAKGLHLAPDGFFGLFTTFVESAPKHERFRLEPTDTKGGLFSEEYDPEDEQVQMLRQMGWVYRARRGQFFVYSTDDPHAPELHTDPQVQAVTIAALTKFLWKSLRNTLILTAFYIMLYFGDALVSLSVALGSWRAGLLLGLMLWDLGRSITALVVLSRYRRQLQNGQPLPHRSNRRKGLYLISGAVRKALWVALVIALIAHLMPMMTEEDYLSLDEHTAPLPFATLEDLYPGAEVERLDGILENRIYGWSDPLAPENYEFMEYAEVSRDGKTVDCYLTVQYHRTRWEWVARALAKEFVSQAGGNPFDQLAARFFGDEPVQITELALPGADYCAYYYRNMPEPYLILQKDNVVLKVRIAVLSQAAERSPEELAQMILSQIR